MRTKLVGYVHKAGEFTDPETNQTIQFDNIILNILTDVYDDNSCVESQGGMFCSTLKIKSAQFNSLFPVDGEIVTPSDLTKWLDKDIKLEYSLLGSKPVLCGIFLKK